VSKALAAAAQTGQLQHRAFLDVEDIEAERNPGTVYGVYVNLPENASQADFADHHVGNVSLFGVERARNPRGDEHGHGLHVSMEITDVLDRLAEQGSWSDGQHLDVAFVPIALEPPAGNAGAAAEQVASTAHADLPITIGRVSIHFA
jgi:tyrosinase